MVFLINDLDLDPSVVAKIYEVRWQIELFFNWIKQNLRIKVFYGASESAVKNQIWIAVCACLVVAILNMTSGLNQNLSRILQGVSVNVFSKDPIHELRTINDTIRLDVADSKRWMFNNFLVER